MRASHRLIITLALLPFWMSCGTALGADGIMITVDNDSSDNLVVTVTDQNANPPQLVLASRTVYGSASLTLSITADESGHGHLSWTARTLDPDMRKCGHKDKPNLNDGDTVHVHADGDCGAAP
jgi:hypothetical protein